MPRAIPPALRRAVVRRHRNGQPVARIAAELALSPRSVRHLLRQFEAHGESALAANYQACGRWRQFSAGPRRRALKLREQHPRWGAGRLHIELTRWFAPDELPSPRTLQRWLRSTRPAPAGRPVRRNPARATRPHEVWQMDAAEQKRLGNHQAISWLRWADECSGAVLRTIVFPPRALHAGTARARAGAFAAGFCRVGTARGAARRQWCTVGLVERPAHSPGAVADWFGHRDAVEHASPTARERRDRTQPRPGRRLGRAVALPHAASASTPIASRGSPAARGLSQPSRSISSGRLSRAAALRPQLQQALGTAKLGLAACAGPSERLLRAAACGSKRQDRAVPRQALRGHHAQGPRRLFAVRPRSLRMVGQRSPGPSVARSSGHPMDAQCSSTTASSTIYHPVNKT